LTAVTRDRRNFRLRQRGLRGAREREHCNCEGTKTFFHFSFGWVGDEGRADGMPDVIDSVVSLGVDVILSVGLVGPSVQRAVFLG
jgi:hypothetical protein